MKAPARVAALPGETVFVSDTGDAVGVVLDQPEWAESRNDDRLGSAPVLPPLEWVRVVDRDRTRTSNGRIFEQSSRWVTTWRTNLR